MSILARLVALALILAVGSLPVRAQTIAITGGRVLPVSGPAIENGTVIVRDGRIVAVGSGITIPSGARRIDASGKVVTPGLINSATTLGIVEVGAVGETNDAFASPGDDAVNSSVRVWDAINPASVLFAPARNEGVTTVGVIPMGGLVAGQSAIVDLLSGTDAPGLIVKAPSGMVASTVNAPGSSTRAQTLARMRELLDDARAYRQRRSDYDRGASRELSASRSDLEALLPVLDGTVPFIILADRASDIMAAVRLAREHDIRVVIGGGAEAWQVADSLAAARVPVLTGAMNNIPNSFAELGTRQETPALLRQAGVTVGLIGNAGGGGEDGFNVRNIRWEAGNAVAYGMSWDEALRSVTLSPAEIFGIADRYGSLEPGKVANVVVWSGDPFEFGTTADVVVVRGAIIEGESRQDELMRRYRTPPPNYLQPTGRR